MPDRERIRILYLLNPLNSKWTLPPWVGVMERPDNATLPNRPTRLLRTRVIENLPLITEAPPAAAADGPLPEIPGYQLLGLLGEGGMGVVYKARQLALKRLVALKMIAAEHRSAARRRFLIEAETVARLQHANFVQIYEVGEHAGRPYLALELIEGGTLADLLARTEMMPARDAALLVATLAHAMHHAHMRGVVHRDLKPGNVLLAESKAGSMDAKTVAEVRAARSALPVPKISDFGLAKLLDEEHVRTQSGSILGTPAYMAPEQAVGRGMAVGPRTDVYALGAILYECLTGRPPFVGATSWDVIVQVTSDDPVAPSRLRPRLARDLDTICLTALAKDPGRRYATAEDLAADLERFAAGEAIAARPESRVSKLARRLRKRPLTVAATLLATGAVMLGSLFWVGRVAEAKNDLTGGRELVAMRALPEADARFQQGLARLAYVPGATKLATELQSEHVTVQLYWLAERLRFQYDPDEMNRDERDELAESCRQIWAKKD